MTVKSRGWPCGITLAGLRPTVCEAIRDGRASTVDVPGDKESGEEGDGFLDGRRPACRCLLRGGADRRFAQHFGCGVGDDRAFEEVAILRPEHALLNMRP